MIVIERNGTKATFEDVEDVRLDADYYRYNTHVFDGSLPYDVKIRWAEISRIEGTGPINGWLYDQDDHNPTYIFIDQRLKTLGVRFMHFIDLVLLHEMCHFKAPRHDSAFIREFLLALERISWEPLVGLCLPYSLSDIFQAQPDVLAQDDRSR